MCVGNRSSTTIGIAYFLVLEGSAPLEPPLPPSEVLLIVLVEVAVPIVVVGVLATIVLIVHYSVYFFKLT